ncbi:penicillin acylase family protein [Nocardioides sp. C4-1]|uniref:penicillin acylase family protein n=1 Tax=Nocardioides sp. C4-1 TaxID=3151851 RepID=UPI0032668310
MTTTTDEPPAAPRRPRAPLWWRRFRLLPRPLRWTAYVAVALTLVLVASLLTGLVLVRRSFPQTSGEVELPGLMGEVEVVRDDAGVPQLYADTTEDLMRAQGYVHAQERFFQMDVRRHAASGRLAELVGEEAVPSDALARTLGWRRVAEAELPLLDPETRVALDAYAAGVNAYLAGRAPSRIALEYTVLNARGLGYSPERWTAVDSLVWLKAVAWDLRGGMRDEIDRTLTTAAVGEQRADQLWPAYPYDEHAAAVRQGAVVDGVFEQDADANGTRLPTRPAPFTSAVADDLRRLADVTDAVAPFVGRGDGLGSNAWAVSGTHTASGEPILANDPHLGVELPGVFTQVGLHCRAVGPACPYDVAGFSYAGVPGVVIGHNDQVAWGFANLGADVTDLYVEKVVGDEWRRGKQRQPLETRTETIGVADGDDVTIEVRATDHGPIVSDLGEPYAAVADAADVPRQAGQAELELSLSWTGLEPGSTADALLALGRARDWTSFRAAAADLSEPAQNIVYADRDGHVGYQAAGRIPIRKSGNDGRLPSPGWRSDTDWTGELVPPDGLPSVLDPDEGLVVTANQAVIEGDYPYALASDYDRGYRSQRIRDLVTAGIDDGDGVTVDDAVDTQLDTTNPLADVLVPHLLEQRLPGGYGDDGQRLLDNWDHTQPAEGGQSAAAAYFNAVWRNLLSLTFADELPAAQRPDGGQRWIAVVTDLLERPDDPWWDDVTTDDVVERRDDVLAQALLDARDDLTAAISPRPDEWTWGALHELDLRGRRLGDADSDVVRRLFDRGDRGAPGGNAAVGATGWDARRGFEVTTAPAMRMVVDLGDLDASRWVNLTGASGHAFHPHYTDQTDLMMRGETRAWAFSRNAVTDAGDDVLTLVPGE